MSARRWICLLGVACAAASGAVGAFGVVQSRESPRLAFVCGGGEATGPMEIRRALAGMAIEVSVFAPGTGGDVLDLTTAMSSFDVVFIDGSTEGIARYAEQVATAAARTRVVVVDEQGGIEGNVPLADHPWIARYWANPSQDNYRRLAGYLLAHVAQAPVEVAPVEPPVEYPTQAFYHPDARALFPSAADYLAWYRTRQKPAHAYASDRLTIGIYYNMTAYRLKNVSHIDALIREVEARGHNAVALAYQRRPSLTAFADAGRPIVDALLFAGSVSSGAGGEAAVEDARRLGVPVLGAMTHSALTPDAFAASPTGLHPTLTPAVVDAEREGRIEPIVISGRGAAVGDRFEPAPMADQVAWRVDRALAWARLRRLENAEKRIVITFWSEGGGKANIGGDPDDFLDVPASVVRLLHALRERGYDVGKGPLPDRDALARRMARDVSNVGNWAPAELAARVKRGDVRLIPEVQYREWFDRLPTARRTEIVDMWGPPPGDVMVYRRSDRERYLAVPTLTFGNVVVAPHPTWGYLQDRKALMSEGALPPHHQYVAFFMWLQHDWHADAWVSLFTNISLQPGKAEGPAADDHIALLLGSLPHIHPERLGANGGVANKRKAMARTLGWYNVVGRPAAPESASRTDGLMALRAKLARYEGQADARLRADAESLIRRDVARTGLDRLIDVDARTAPMSTLLPAVRAELDRLALALAPGGTKVLGDAPAGDALVDMVVAMRGRDLHEALDALTPHGARSATDLVRDVLDAGTEPDAALTARFGTSSEAAVSALEAARATADALAAAPREVDSILEALDGRWIEPGPMDDPVRRPDALPPGRSLYNFDQAAIPTPEAEVTGVRQAEALIAAHRAAHGGAFPQSLAFVLFSGEIAKNLGVTEAEVLHLLGTRAVRDARGAVTGVELIPREALGRPRVDVVVTTSGTYRDHYQDKVALMAEAARLAASSPEPDNPVAAATRKSAEALEGAGIGAGCAEALAAARVFAPAPGAYSPSIQFLAKSGDQRGDEARMAELYASRMSHAYGAGLYGEAARSIFNQRVSQIDAATLPRSGYVNGMLEQPMSAGFLGGLSLAARAAGNADVDLYVSNLRDPAEPSTESAAVALQREMRTRYFNETWLREMKAHGYDGARNLMFFTDNLDLWSSTTEGVVTSQDWAEVKRVYVEDSLDLDIDRFFDTYNPHAQQVLLANLLGAAVRGQWQASQEDLRMVASRLARSAADHGAVCEASVCRNPELTRAVTAALADVPGGAALATGYRAAIARATVASAAPATTAGRAPGRGAPPVATPVASAPVVAPAGPPVVSGFAMREVPAAAEAASAETGASAALVALAVLAGGLVAVGWFRADARTRAGRLNVSNTR